MQMQINQIIEKEGQCQTNSQKLAAGQHLIFHEN